MIIRTNSRALFAIAYGILQNREEAEDVVQDSLVKAWKTRWRVRDPEKFPAWLGTIARHRAHDTLRKRRPVPFSDVGKVSNLPRRNLESCATIFVRSTPAFRAGHAARAPSRRAYAALFRRDGLSHHRKYAWPDQWRATRNSRSRPGIHAQTASSRSRFNGLIIWQPFTTKLITGSPPIFTASFRRTNAALFTRTSSIARNAEKLIRKPKL